MSVQHTGKWIERISQSDRALPWGYFIINTIASICAEIEIYNNLHLARKYACIFVRGHYLFQKANSFSRAKLEENCEPWRTDNVRGQIPEHIFKVKWKLLSLIFFRYFSQHPGSASLSYTNHIKGCRQLASKIPASFSSFSILRLSNILRFSWRNMLLKKCKIKV